MNDLAYKTRRALSISQIVALEEGAKMLEDDMRSGLACAVREVITILEGIKRLDEERHELEQHPLRIVPSIIFSSDDDWGKQSRGDWPNSTFGATSNDDRRSV